MKTHGLPTVVHMSNEESPPASDDRCIQDDQVSYYDTPVVVLASAFKHGVTTQSIEHGVKNALVVEEVDVNPLRFLILGPDVDGNLLELVVLDRRDGPCVIHAMKMRAKYQALLPKGDRS